MEIEERGKQQVSCFYWSSTYSTSSTVKQYVDNSSSASYFTDVNHRLKQQDQFKIETAEIRYLKLIKVCILLDKIREWNIKE